MKRPFSAYQGDEPYVFVCYAHEDSDAIYPEIQRLHEGGVRIWYDEGISPGARWSDELAGALGKASLVLFFCTSQSVKSQHCQDEVNFALDEKRPLLVVQDGKVDAPPGLRLRLGAHQSILKHELNADQFVDKLTTAISRYLDVEPRVRSNAPMARRAATPLRTRWMMLGGIAIGALALAYISGDKLWNSQDVVTEQPVVAVTSTVAAAATAISAKSIAVLPFTDMSEKQDQEYLADGMAEAIIDLLSQVPGLLVPARTSSFFFKGKQTKIPDIARDLGVANVLEGSIRRSGDHLRVTAQLVRADNGYHVWSETYDRELRDVFKVQDDIANAVVQALQIKLMGGELSRRKGGTQNLEAYQLYLQAMSALNQNTKKSLDIAGVYLEQVIKLDPAYGMAWYALATVASMKTDNAWLAPTQGWERVRRLAQHALLLSPDLAEAHARLQWVYMSWDWDWPAAEAEGRQALAIDPMNPTALLAAGRLAATLGRSDDSERKFRAALVRDPLNTYLIWNLGFAYYRAGRLEESEGLYRRLLELEPGFLWTRSYLAKTLLAQGKPDAALVMAQQEADEATRLWFLPVFLQAAGHQAEADEALQAQIAQWADTGAFFVAMTYAYRGDHDRTLEWLERAYRQKDASLDEITGEPLFKNMADDVRYQAFLRQLKLPE